MQRIQVDSYDVPFCTSLSTNWSVFERKNRGSKSFRWKSPKTSPKRLKFSLMYCFVLPRQLGDFKVLHKKDFTHTKQRDSWVSDIVELLLLIVQPTSVSKTGPFELIRWCVISKHHILGCQRQAKSVSFPESNGVEQCIHMGEVFPVRFLFRENSMEVTLTPNGNTEPRGVSHTMAA